ncbi:MAG: DUF4276 family protein [Thiothrix sp.]|nr:DUF4276 family protein [Thiothrix sp.]
MIRLHITAEGQTEQRFVNEVLRPHLAAFGVYTDVRCVITSKDNRASKEFRGGMTTYARARNDILNWMKEDSAAECRFTTMFDLYALPDDFPGFASVRKHADPYARVAALEQALKEDIGSQRFIPYIQLHEFEALILADVRALDLEYLEHENPIRNLQAMVGGQNPELINDGRETAPSRRIIREIPEYDKVTSGVSVAGHIGLPVLREKCMHFDEWVTRLEQLGSTS